MVVRDSSRVLWPGWVTLAALLAAGGASHPSAVPESFDPLRVLVRAASLSSRDVAPRLSGGFAWAPLHPVMRGADGELPPDRLPMQQAAGELDKERGSDPAPKARQALAVASLLVGDPRRAVTALDTLTKEQPEAARWNDLAASQFVVAQRNDDPALLARALVAADAALEADPVFAEARFNRALILEAFGLRDQARQEWQTYLGLDAGSGWALEARQHLQALPPQEEFAARFQRRYPHLLADAGEAQALARNYPQEARVAGEEEILAKWGEAILAGDEAQAVKHLGLARELGAELLRHGGDGMLPALVESIERAGPAERTALANAHIHFHQGRELYRRDRKLKEAEQSLTAAVQEFASGRSPGELLARVFEANTIYEQNRQAEVTERLQGVLVAARGRYPALRAEVQREMGGVAFAQSRWGACIDAFQESLAIYERMGERNYAGVLRSNLAFVYARVGEPEQAWNYRAQALRELGRSPSFRLHQAIDAVTQAALADGDWPVAVSFLALDSDLAERMGNPLVTIESHLSRADLEVRQQHREAAERDLREAKRTIARLPAAADRRHYEANANEVEATLTGNPATAVALLTAAIEFHNTVSRMHLPWLYMLRGRAWRTMGDDGRAAEDFEAGIAQLESDRTSLADGEDRWGVFHAGEELFASARDLALDQGDVKRAFAYAERERARGLLDTLKAAWRPVTPSDIPAGTVVVEYASHENTLVLFTLDAQGAHAVRQNVARKTLKQQIAAFNEELASEGDAQRRASARTLYKQLIEPVEQRLAGAKRVAFVPDPRLGNLSFGALRDATGRFAIQNYPITVEPSAAVFTRLHTPAPATPADRRVLIVTGSNDLGVLSFANGEARAVARQYGQVRQLSREGATAIAFAREAAAADVVHFVGHGVSSTGPRESGYLLLHGDDEGDGRLDVKRIAALKLPRTSLVVLAACATAAGEIRSTEGTISVARAFLAAGVPSVVATLRPIPDEEAARFFPRFHQYLSRGLSPAEALRQTQLDWIARGDEAAAMWTAVQVIGE